MNVEPFYVLEEPDLIALFMLGAEDDVETVENVDAELRLRDGTRWSATFMTLSEITRIMDRWARTGENVGGSYFQCPDLIIFPSGGVRTMRVALRAIVDSGGLKAR